MILFDYLDSFQRGWFNHQLENLKQKYVLFRVDQLPLSEWMLGPSSRGLSTHDFRISFITGGMSLSPILGGLLRPWHIHLKL